MTNQEGFDFLVFYKMKNGETIKKAVATVTEIILPGRKIQ